MKTVHLKLNKSLYGLKQSPRCWNEKLNNYLIEIGFARSRHDYCLYTKQSVANVIILIIYVDDLLIAANTIYEISEIKKQLEFKFEMSDCGELKHYLGIKVQQKSNGITMNQETNINKILIKYGMHDCNACVTPIEKGIHFDTSKSENISLNPSWKHNVSHGMLSSRFGICGWLPWPLLAKSN